jgi:hypothetical protein
LRQAWIYARPDYSSNTAKAARKASDTTHALRSADQRDLADLHLTDLPGTARESAVLT